MSVEEIDPCSCFSIAVSTTAVTILCTATSKSQFAIKAPTFSLCFTPFPFSAQSVALMHFLTNRPKAAHVCSVALVSDKCGADSSVIKYSCICFSDRQAESAHTFSFQKILLNLIFSFSAPLNHSSSY